MAVELMVNHVILKEGMHIIKLNFTSSSEAEYGTPTLAYYPPRPA
jgi:hypothetical protein